MEARRLEDQVQELYDGALESHHLGRQTVELDARGGVGFVLRSVDQLRVQTLDEPVELGRRLANQVLCLAVRIEGRAPNDAALGVVEIAERLAKPGNEIGLGKHRVDGEVDPQGFMQLQQALADRCGVVFATPPDPS